MHGVLVEDEQHAFVRRETRAIHEALFAIGVVRGDGRVDHEHARGEFRARKFAGLFRAGRHLLRMRGSSSGSDKRQRGERQIATATAKRAINKRMGNRTA